MLDRADPIEFGKRLFWPDEQEFLLHERFFV
jgi:hypothetical protein